MAHKHSQPSWKVVILLAQEGLSVVKSSSAVPLQPLVEVAKAMHFSAQPMAALRVAQESRSVVGVHLETVQSRAVDRVYLFSSWVCP